MRKKWEEAEAISDDFTVRFPEIDPIVLQLLVNRKIIDPLMDIETAQKKINEFLTPEYDEDLHDPFLFSQMKKAVKRIFKAIKDKEKIVVHGDYDADGVSSSVLLKDVLSALGAEVEVYIPHREIEGYGLNKKTVKNLNKEGVKLIITTDCGIANFEEIELANQLNLDVIITDHHLPKKEIPRALAIINPHTEKNYPFKYLSGAGVSFKLAQALIRSDEDKIKGKLEKEGFEKWLLDLAAIGTITDMMPLTGENRTLVKYGLMVLNKTRRLGLRKLMEGAGIKIGKIDSSHVAFILGPRLNAAGRINHANQAYALLATSSFEEAERLSEELNKTNQERQAMTEKIIKEAKKQIGDPGKKKILFALGRAKEGWSEGVVGLVSGKITEEYHRPSFVMVETGEKIKGSGRSIPQFDITQSLQKIDYLFERFGGHKGACGFTIKNKEDLEKIKKELNKMAEEELTEEDLTPKLYVDIEVGLEKIDWPLYEILEKFNPFGQANFRPRYLSRNLEIKNCETVGQTGHHLRLIVGYNLLPARKFIGFSMDNENKYGCNWCEKLKAGDKVDIVFEVDINQWNGTRELQLKIIDLKYAREN